MTSRRAHLRATLVCTVRRLAPAFLALALVPAPAGGQAPVAAPSAAGLLRSVLLAPTLIDYEGTKIISTLRPGRFAAGQGTAPGGSMETVTILEAHKRPNKTRLEFLSPEPLAGRVVVDNGVDTWHYEPSLHVAFQGPSLAMRGAPDLSTRLLEAYDARVLGQEEVIGRPAFVLALRTRPAVAVRLLWVDQSTGVPLRVEEREDGQTVYVAYFTRISFSLNLPEALFRFRAPAGARIFSLFPSEEGAVPPERLDRMVGFRVLHPATMPEGLRFVQATLSRQGSVVAAHLHYTDGASPVSVFQTPARRLADFGPGEGRILARGDRRYRVMDLGYFRAVAWELGGLRITVVGAQPLAVLLALADQIGRAP